LFGVKAVGVDDPAEAARGDAVDAVGDSMLVAEFGGAVGEQSDERAVDVAESEEAEVEVADVVVLAPGLKPQFFSRLSRRSRPALPREVTRR
jgi:hypothetical protein